MKILCLHGVGSSGNILQNQLRPFMKVVDPSIEFVFVDGPEEVSRGPGVGPAWEGPFFSHTTGYSPDEMNEALNHFDNTLSELGPFDGVLGFSQGGALTISYLYDMQVRGVKAPFKFALICSSVIPCSPDTDCSKQVIQRFCSLDHDLSKPSSPEEELGPEERLYKQLLAETVIAAKSQGQLQPDYEMEVYSTGNGQTAPRVMYPQMLKTRIQIPTVHVVGKRDFACMQKMSSAAYGLCDERMSRKLEHSGGHQPPQKDVEVKALVRAMNWAIDQAQKAEWKLRL